MKISLECKERWKVMKIDQLHSNGHRNGHLAQVERQPKRVDYPRLLALGHELLLAIGEDPEREGLRETPRRWADAWREFIEYDPGATETTFSSVTSDQLVCVSGIRVASLCEHHLLPFWCDVSIGYIPDDKVLGLSKFARIAQQFAHRLQLQERMGREIANEITRITRTMNVAVVLTGEHYCMAARGIRSPGRMTSSVMRGIFRTDSATRLEFLQLIE
jgi:GTP cyclohydrolase IA